MAYPAGAAHVVYSGTLVGGEEWAFGYWNSFTGSTPDAASFQASFEALIDLQVPRLTTMLQRVLAGSCTAADAYHYAGGSNRSNLVAHVDLAIPGGNTAVHPDQVSIVVTQLTGLPGRSRRGRSYLPGNGNAGEATAGQDRQLEAAICTALANDMAAIMNFGPAQGWAPRVVSSTLGAMTPITQVRVDSKYDTQRRRAESVQARTQALAPVNNV